jgi:Ser/Thr protein kinase RdoA (MazF antagonist)
MSTPAAGIRLEYAALPERVRAWVDAELGASVVSAVTQTGGFSPGVAARLATADGGRAFVKAVGAELNRDTPELFRLERVAMESLPVSRHAPRLLSAYDDGGWVALLLGDIEGRMPGHPWTQPDADLVFGALAELTATLQPSPWPGAPRAETKMRRFLSGWHSVRAAPPADLDPWARRHLDGLVALSERALVAIRGDALAHWDVRSDNVLITPEAQVVFVDWAHACLSAAWVDPVIAACDVLGDRDVDVDELLGRFPAVRASDPADITVLVAALTGGLAWSAYQPAPPGLPTIRPWQHEQAATLLGWVRRRSGWS